MFHGEEWPVKFAFQPTVEVSHGEVTDASRCMLCRYDHTSGECPNPLRACKFYGGVGRHQECCLQPPQPPLVQPPKVCCYCGVEHYEEPECLMKWQEQFPDEYSVQKGFVISFTKKQQSCVNSMDHTRPLLMECVSSVTF